MVSVNIVHVLTKKLPGTKFCLLDKSCDILLYIYL